MDDGPIVADGGRPHTANNEGGPIPIESILAKRNPAGSLDPGNRRMLAERMDEPVKVTRHTDNSRDDSVSIARSAAPQSPPTLKVTLGDTGLKTEAATNAAISGEWARAMVFELAGGEPAEILQPATRHQIRLNSSPTDTSAADADRQPLNPGAQLETRRTDAEVVSSVRIPASAVEDEPLKRPTPDTVRMTGIVLAQLSAFARGQNWDSEVPPLSMAALIAANSLVSATHGIANGNPPTTANSDMLAELDALEASSSPPSGDEVNVGKPFNASPLIMVLALERVNAANVRRARKEAAWPPRTFVRESNDSV
jgi:hypothetical protein